ncbi:MAG: riboflavin biosynthesis protein RibF [Candidatus Cloacimonetes bacterium HGW-Cloacimonetes-3]|jgi:riboflavin kinase/FMN adenylyltransferase|nr:MAG: riboflavin biosynthesis protein RibF [Candidatus Cloacimonetes bacterium HGW-Cloacimonetes-3]
MNNHSVLTIGNFDGIHLGHQKLLVRMIEAAHSEGLQSVVLSYTVHPAFTLKAHAKPSVLCPAELKQRQLYSLGIDMVELLTFNSEFAKISASQFLYEYILPVWHPKLIVMGYDSHFGFKRTGDYHFLLQHADKNGFRVEYVEPLEYRGSPISSSMIRELLAQGDILSANKLLGKPYRLLGEVGHGIGRGKGFGFPTANLILSNPHQLIPREGIYLSRVHLEGATFFGLTNIGSSPTVKHSGVVEIETYIIGFTGDIYNRYMELELMRYLREERMFRNVEELITAMNLDLSLAESIINGGEV